MLLSLSTLRKENKTIFQCSRARLQTEFQSITSKPNWYLEVFPKNLQAGPWQGSNEQTSTVYQETLPFLSLPFFRIYIWKENGAWYNIDPAERAEKDQWSRHRGEKVSRSWDDDIPHNLHVHSSSLGLGSPFQTTAFRPWLSTAIVPALVSVLLWCLGQSEWQNIVHPIQTLANTRSMKNIMRADSCYWLWSCNTPWMTRRGCAPVPHWRLTQGKCVAYNDNKWNCFHTESPQAVFPT